MGGCALPSLSVFHPTRWANFPYIELGPSLYGILMTFFFPSSIRLLNISSMNLKGYVPSWCHSQPSTISTPPYLSPTTAAMRASGDQYHPSKFVGKDIAPRLSR